MLEGALTVESALHSPTFFFQCKSNHLVPSLPVSELHEHDPLRVGNTSDGTECSCACVYTTTTAGQAKDASVPCENEARNCYETFRQSSSLNLSLMLTSDVQVHLMTPVGTIHSHCCCWDVKQ